MRLDWLQPKVHHHHLLADAQAVGLFFLGLSPCPTRSPATNHLILTIVSQPRPGRRRIAMDGLHRTGKPHGRPY